MKNFFLTLIAAVWLLVLLCGCIPSEETEQTGPTLPAPSVVLPTDQQGDPEGILPTQATAPSVPTPSDPFSGGSDRPTLPTQAPGQSDDPGQPGKPADPGKPSDPGKPADPGKPTDPTQPTQPLPPDSAEDLVTMPASPEDLH